jgi:transcriptional regulator with XRE-family HTH domain
MSQKLFVDKVTVMLRHYREASGMSQSELAEAIQIGLRSYQRYESGESVPSIDIVYLMSKALNFELKDLFCPRELTSQVPGLKIFDHDNQREFLTHTLVVESRLVDIFKSDEFARVLETGDIKLIRESELFRTNPYAVALSGPKHTIINQVVQRQSGIHHDSVPTTTGHDDPRALGIAWANFMDRETCYFQQETRPSFPRGEARMITRGIFAAQNNHYFILSVAEIEFIRNKQ